MMTLPPENGLTLPRPFSLVRIALFFVTLSATIPVRDWIVVATTSEMALLANMTDSPNRLDVDYPARSLGHPTARTRLARLRECLSVGLDGCSVRSAR